MAVGGGAGVDRPAQLQMLTNAPGRQVDHILDNHRQFFLVHPARPVGVDEDRQRFRYANGVGDLEGAFVGQAGGDHVLRHIARRVGGRPVDLGRVLAGKGAAAVQGGPAVGVDNDLAASQAGVSIGSAPDETSRRIDVEFILLTHPAFR